MHPYEFYMKVPTGINIAINGTFHKMVTESLRCHSPWNHLNNSLNSIGPMPAEVQLLDIHCLLKWHFIVLVSTWHESHTALHSWICHVLICPMQPLQPAASPCMLLLLQLVGEQCFAKGFVNISRLFRKLAEKNYISLEI